MWLQGLSKTIASSDCHNNHNSASAVHFMHCSSAAAYIRSLDQHFPVCYVLGFAWLQDAGLLGGLLGCFGQLFTATIAPGWPTQTQDNSLLAASKEMHSSSCNSSSADGTAAPQAIVTLRNNEVTRVKANLEAAAFESAVSPRIAVRLLHMLVLAVAHKFGSGSSKRLEIIHKVGCERPRRFVLAIIMQER